MTRTDTVKLREQSWTRRYGLAFLWTAAAAWVTVSWAPATARPYTAPLAAVILAAWFSGFRPALFSLALSTLAINIYLAEMRPEPWGVADLVRTALFAGIALLITAFARARESSEREARRQAAHLEAMFGQASLGISRLSLDGRLTRVNRCMADIIGRSIEDSVGLMCEQITHPDDWPSHARLIEQVAGGSLKEIAIDKRYLRPNGTSVWVHVSMAPLLDDQGQAEGLIAIVEDIAERHEAEDLLRASENRYRSLVDATTAIVWTADASGSFTVPQESWQASTGQDAGRYAGFGWAAAIHPEDRARVQALWKDALARPRAVDTETRIWNSPTLSYRWYSARVVPRFDADGAVEEWVGACTDIHERRVAEIQLRESEERARLALDIAQLGTMTWVSDDDDVLADPRCREICGLPASGAIALADLEVRIHPGDRAHVLTGLSDAATYARPYAEEFRFEHPDGAVRWVVARGDVVTRPGNTTVPVRVLLLSLMDVTERRLAEEGLKQADREKDDFLALLAHELRNPLAPIRTAVQLLKMRKQPDIEGQRLHAVIDRQVQHLVRMVDDLLDVSRVLRGKVGLRREPIEIADAIAIAVETSRPLIDAQKQHLQLTLPGNPVTVHGDAVRLSQVIANLLNNASKYSDTGATIQLAATQTNDEVVIEVRDAGAGIPGDVLPRVFEPFVQADRSLERSRGGLGIGLTLVKKIVELHHGQVAAESAGLGQGSAFTIRLPAHAGTPLAAHAAEQPPVIAFPARVLVVDDNVDAAESLALLLQSDGHTVSVAHTGVDAVRRAESWLPDIAVLDVGLPGMNGYEVASLLRQRGDACPELIAVTGYGQSADTKRALDAGFRFHLVKPVDARDLTTAIARCAVSRQARRA
ncbi:MAG TPA: PAS domain S-box protein [Vicinamibacterales bacterium]|jgi:PAS domain S-box-containing protein|nr:PAS domain S-box protein [Vicinamibacterales bacterium]